VRSVCLLGSTGSIGSSTLDVIRRSPDRYRVHSLVAGSNVDLLVRQIQEFSPVAVVVATETALSHLTERLADSGLARSRWPELGWGPAARVAAATDGAVDFVLSAIVGVAGLEATYEAVVRGTTEVAW
jgi:1-deoxy-D-xylulose-5-phosphate reductoisomerase